MNDSVFSAQTYLFVPKMPPQDPKYYSNPHPFVLIVAAILVIGLVIFTVIQTIK